MALLRNCRIPPFNIFKINLRACSQANSTQVKHEENPQHVYKKKFTKSELVDHMFNSIIYNQDGIIVLDKPYGISVRSQVPIHRAKFTPRTFETLNLNDVIQDLAVKLNLQNLKINKASERYSSGILILTSNEIGERKLLKYIRRSEGKNPPASYLVVTQYNPCRDKNRKGYGLQFEANINGVNYYHLAEKWSYSSQKQNKTVSIHVSHKTLCSSDLASLVRVNIKPIFKNALRLYMATKCLSPILGDDRFSQRIVIVDGVAVDLGCQNPQSRRHFELPPEYLNALQLENNESSVVPVHMHLHSFKFLISKDFRELNLEIDPPEWFIWTCEQLKLDIRKVLKLNKKTQ